jgi:hypothetical protein
VFKDKIKFQIVEQARRDILPELTPDLREAVTALALHPGFDYLMRKFRLQRSLLEAKLRSDRFATLTDVEFIQNGIFWIDWLDNQVKSLSKRPSSTSTFATQEEEDAFKAVQAAIEVIK